VYNRARREHPDLPPNPCENVDFNGARRRRQDEYRHFTASSPCTQTHPIVGTKLF